MAYFVPRHKMKLKTDTGPKGIAVTSKQVDPESGYWRPVRYLLRVFTDTIEIFAVRERGKGS